MSGGRNTWSPRALWRKPVFLLNVTTRAFGTPPGPHRNRAYVARRESNSRNAAGTISTKSIARQYSA